MRLFIAIDVPPWIKESLAIAQKKLPSEGIRLVEPRNMHITLKFLGEVSPKKLQEIEQKLSKLEEKNFQIVVKGVGTFPNEQYVKVVWVGCKTKELAQLAEKINKALPEFPAESFAEHITIARVSRKTNLKAFLDMYRDFRFGDFKAEKFWLMSSELTPAGPKYSVLSEYTLK